ncbi:hypothetical protein FGG08_004405 [Glutinoglossum americanum]|uniref:Manganese lipoxygenase n=1 Tax=Glutinoglossum americanum TaxID=1670608 RepID=A0A9P8I2G8_9PEZI|nr:hypothetical protein FGG08_004405 [Glutinoglossum americanum]
MEPFLFASEAFLLWLLLAADAVSAFPRPPQRLGAQKILHDTLSLPRRNLTLPVHDPAPCQRITELERNRKGYLYGRSLIGDSSYFISGELGDRLIKEHLDLWYRDAAWVSEAVENGSRAVAEAVARGGGLGDLASYELLYRDQWQEVNPAGVAPGVHTNYTQDLFFSMERLSANAFSVRRLHPTKDRLPFAVEESIVQKLTGLSLSTLHVTGRLFLSDHSYQLDYLDTLSKGRYSAACSAYFYIHPVSNEFLPLAIKTNVGENLTYTPLDEHNDWMLAKMLYNSNDLFHGQVSHLASSHAVAEIVHQAALRTMSKSHPVRAYLDRIMYQAYAIRPVGESALFSNGGFFDTVFSTTNPAVRRFATKFYPATVGRFRANYLVSALESRGLINCTYGPALQHFPLFEDAAPVVGAMRRFATSFVDAYYLEGDLMARDHELQEWALEATGPAKVLDFPTWPLMQKETLVDILTHMAYLTGVSHHVLNSGTPCTTTGVLPFHPAAIFQPIPKSKGVKSLLPYLPDLGTSIAQIGLFIRFNRAKLIDGRGCLVNMFSDDGFLHGQPNEVQKAAEEFKGKMEEISKIIRGREFDQEGKAQGIPFIWRGMDPSSVPYYLSV